MAYISADVEIDVSSMWDECSQSEKEELRDLVCDEFDLPYERDESKPKNNTDTIVDMFDHVDTIEARDFVRLAIDEIQWRLKMRDFPKSL